MNMKLIKSPDRVQTHQEPYLLDGIGSLKVTSSNTPKMLMQYSPHLESHAIFFKIGRNIHNVLYYANHYSLVQIAIQGDSRVQKSTILEQ